MAQVKMTVNGKAASGDVEGRTLLVQFLREDLGMTGTHVGCDTSQCGACVVHVDGVAVKSCTMLAVEADGAEVATIEGQAAADGTLNTIQQAFQDHHGLQCGFCTPGMVMSAAALLKDNPKPTEEDVRHYLDGNICRCTGYHNIVKAIMAASGQDVSSIAAE
ncbi:(2Fe-2S)-binding protein [Sulfitobacter donghicola]|uniref:Carbon monoxide dehydrogenase n=1 Tax=Sulfitobacter donghicola DSW-25 = KCTC 12864 = JCM 14565 TaxID=1300350 RepID=A0A073IL71_9RHOB|nr:(2Fe-2S)-binding protein [Sulfitobacter donghicola]KEJ90256.1 carbon monoxide dehydrogenase [Sulfitobacter donghicola DSW-25 = KCTC 12864 = JCM 14565]KIN66574.1 Carbon-monoxide dehydrogenase, small subunit [Sulfitobacter donghicola DSW-25 = KCTC 12864 = JCM 14565]